MKFLLILVPVLFVSGCETAPVVSQFNGDSVNIQTSQFEAGAKARAESLEEAKRICGKVGKRAEYASTRPMPNQYTDEHLFLCL